MTDPVTGIPQRSYGCQMGCGNPYDVILTEVREGTAQFLCTPCWLGLANQVAEALTGKLTPELEAQIKGYTDAESEAAPGPAGMPGTLNLPLTASGPDLWADQEADDDPGYD